MLAEPEKSFLQALVQVSAAFHHLQRGNRTGAISLLTRSLRRFERSPSEFFGMNVAKISDQVHNWLIMLESSSIEIPPDYPVLEICDQNRASD